MTNSFTSWNFNSLPSKSHWTWSTDDPSNPGGRSGVYIAANDTRRPTNGLYGIAVLSKTMESDFTISATTDEDAMTLRSGVPSPRRVIQFRGETQHFTLQDLTMTSDIILSLNVFSGEAYMLLNRREPQTIAEAPHCTPAGPPGDTSPPKCRNATWVTMDAGQAILQVDHLHPCDNAQAPPVAPAVCDASVDF